MAATVELIDGFQFEIAGSVQFPLSSSIVKDLGLDALSTIEPEVMSVNLGGVDDEPMIFYRDPMRLMNHLNDKHGQAAVAGMAELLAWSSAPARALGRFDVRQPPKSYDEMFDCATNEAERAAINDILFGSAADVLDRYFPDKKKHAVVRAMLAFLAVNSTYRGPQTPGSATCLAFALALPADGAAMMTKYKGGVGALSQHLRQLYESHGGEIRFRRKVNKVLVESGNVAGVQLTDGSIIRSPVVISNLDPGVTLTRFVEPGLMPPDLVTRLSTVDHRAAYIQMHFALDGLPEYISKYDFLNEPGMQGSVSMFCSAEELQDQWEDCQKGVIPENPAVGMQIPTVHDPEMAPNGKHAASAFAFCFPVESDRTKQGKLKEDMAERVIERISSYAPNFRDIERRHITFASYHMESMFGCPGGDFCHGLLHPDQMGRNRPGPRGYVDLPIPVGGLYLASTGCHGGPGITVIPGYNAGYQALEDTE
jgi:phytoene dehydrogenase-like protein